MMQRSIRTEAAYAAAAHVLRRSFDQADVNGTLGDSLELGAVGAAAPMEKRMRLQDDATIMMAGTLVDGRRSPVEGDWAGARAARLVRRYDFKPLVDAIEDALAEYGVLSAAGVCAIARRVRDELDTAAMSEYPLFAAV